MTLHEFIEHSLSSNVDPHVRSFAHRLAGEAEADAVLFYGSNLRTGSLDGVLDFYVLTPGPAERGFWPTVSYREAVIEGVHLRAKIATMHLATFANAAADRTFDTTVWARFTQPSALLWTRDGRAAREVVGAVAAAATTAARYAVALAPERGVAADYWRALFAATYSAELRVDRNGRPGQIVTRDQSYYETLLPLAWAAGGVSFDQGAEQMRPTLAPAERRRVRRRWAIRRLAGKPINIARLIRATATFDGAARYGVWKIERHTGVRIPLTPWRERHPVLAAPGVLYRVWRQAGR